MGSKIVAESGAVVREAGHVVKQGWRRVARIGVKCAVASGLLAVLIVTPPTVVRIAETVDWNEAAQSGGAGVAFQEVQQSLQADGDMNLGDDVWTVDWDETVNDELFGRSRAFDDAVEAEAFAATVGGKVWSSRLIVVVGGTSDRDFPGLLTGPGDRPLVEIVAADGRVLYRSSGVPVAPNHDGPLIPDLSGDLPLRETGPETVNGGGYWSGPTVGGSGGPDVAVCTAANPQYWSFGEGVLVDVEPLGADELVTMCVFRTAEQVRGSQLAAVRAAFGAAGVSWTGYWLFGFPVLAIGAMVVESLRRRIRRAARSDLPALVDNPRPHSLLGGITEEVNHSLSRARMSVEQQRGFVADAAHELRSPLSSLITTLEVAERHPGLVDPVQVNRTSLTQARRLERLTQDLLLLAQLDARTPLRDDQVDLADVVREVADDAADPGRPITLAIHAPAPTIGDRDAFRRITQNLVDNAVRHAATGVEVAIHNDGDRIRVTVANDGTPIRAEDQRRIFERFTRLDGDRARRSGGTGLGLAIARGLAERYGGTLTVLPGRSDGATFVWEILAAR